MGRDHDGVHFAGNNSLSHVVQALNPSQAPDGNGSQPVEGSFGVTAVTKPSGNDMNSDAASAGSATKGEGSTYVTLFGRAGSSTGLIVGIAAGVVILAVVAGGLWYWFKVRKRKDSTSGKSGNSARSGSTANSQDTDASEEEQCKRGEGQAETPNTAVVVWHNTAVFKFLKLSTFTVISLR
ncbi:uncharacterized protein LOC129602048 isoform X2 [Paramacrobiotus metropolitanus]|uniref:uncharacterized protein LOC129602048 isoform X2 n=1 Tax=Paramacrobiotus metropolitanus TaxID=2943436 RepID=UPI0024465B2D|nr:uncharacterized protein LOC129602048 isoform X2 [Paramacrobiotus metropolitanus]